MRDRKTVIQFVRTGGSRGKVIEWMNVRWGGGVKEWVRGIHKFLGIFQRAICWLVWTLSGLGSQKWGTGKRSLRGENWWQRWESERVNECKVGGGGHALFLGNRSKWYLDRWSMYVMIISDNWPWSGYELVSDLINLYRKCQMSTIVWFIFLIHGGSGGKVQSIFYRMCKVWGVNRDEYIAQGHTVQECPVRYTVNSV